MDDVTNRRAIGAFL